MRVHEFAKQLSNETGRTITSSDILMILSKKKEGIKPMSNIDEEMMKFVRSKYVHEDEKKPAGEVKENKPKVKTGNPKKQETKKPVQENTPQSEKKPQPERKPQPEKRPQQNTSSNEEFKGKNRTNQKPQKNQDTQKKNEVKKNNQPKQENPKPSDPLLYRSFLSRKADFPPLDLAFLLLS